MINKFSVILMFFVLVTSVFSCQSTQKAVQEKVFFSLEDYFNEQINLLKQQNYRLEKSVNINEKIEEKIIDKPDFKTELAAFIANDINKPAWKDQYSVDSLIQNNRLTVIRYKAKEEALRTREISIHFDKNGEIEIISLEEGSNSVLSDTKKLMTYISRKQYLIESVETNKAGDKVEVEIFGRLRK